MSEPAKDNAGAAFSHDRSYRYRLWRLWQPDKPFVVFVMLNPSTADEVKNDPKVKRCERRARALGFGGLTVVNIFALRSTDPKLLYNAPDPVGPDNDREIVNACVGAGLVVCAWGNNGGLNGRGRQVLKMMDEQGVNPWHLGITGAGHPRHPLYVPYTTQLTQFGSRPTVTA